VRILRIELDPSGKFEVGPADPKVNRNLYFVSGDKAKVMGFEVIWNLHMKIDPGATVDIENGSEKSVFWILEGEPIGQKMSMFGPILLGTDQEVRDALQTIRLEEFKRWPWDVIDRVNPVDSGRFLLRSDGTRETPPE
jgi:hypothetical protein